MARKLRIEYGGATYHVMARRPGRPLFRLEDSCCPIDASPLAAQASIGLPGRDVSSAPVLAAARPSSGTNVMSRGKSDGVSTCDNCDSILSGSGTGATIRTRSCRRRRPSLTRPRQPSPSAANPSPASISGNGGNQTQPNQRRPRFTVPLSP